MATEALELELDEGLAGRLDAIAQRRGVTTQTFLTSCIERLVEANADLLAMGDDARPPA